MRQFIKIVAWLLGLIALVAVLSGGVYYYLTSMEPAPAAKPTLAVKEETAPKGNKVIEVSEKNKRNVEEEFPMDIDEYSVQEAIHNMSHQKVVAEDKWGFLPLTEERVNRLITIIESNNTKYESAALYLDILKRWGQNDYSKVDQDHNSIWNLQGGNVGKATGILSAEEEKTFIEKHYNIEE